MQKVEYNILLYKAWPCPCNMNEACIPTGSSANPGILLRSASAPSTPFEFPFDMAVQLYCDFNVDDSLS
jgi:hypothetical protein